METIYDALVRALRGLSKASTPRFRTIVRFLALPYCFFALIDWNECKASRARVATDLVEIFFRLRTFPDNYGPCRLWEVPRAEWPLYYGSSYGPWQRHRLRDEVQRKEYEILFEDKEVAGWLFRAAGLPAPETLGGVEPGPTWREDLVALMIAAQVDRAFVKPVRGSAGSGVFVASLEDERLTTAADVRAPTERAVVQRVVQQVEAIAAFNAASVNTIRVLTLLTRDGRVLVLGATMRFGVGSSCRDNWSAGGVAVGVDKTSGRLHGPAFDKRGHRYATHPASGLAFDGFVVPAWDAVVDTACAVQRAFPLYRLLGMDMAVTADGPVVIETNAFPDLVFQEQTSGPLLADDEILREFARWGILVNEAQRARARALDPPTSA